MGVYLCVGSNAIAQSLVAWQVSPCWIRWRRPPGFLDSQMTVLVVKIPDLSDSLKGVLLEVCRSLLLFQV